mmetsp:Transcript_11515/g.26701  ORF Transcript_11515/g.26701 Transcript_11515/m.26701 type:complete len:332 (+) Transcript_11515:636-1631(+)
MCPPMLSPLPPFPRWKMGSRAPPRLMRLAPDHPPRLLSTLLLQSLLLKLPRRMPPGRPTRTALSATPGHPATTTRIRRGRPTPTTWTWRQTHRPCPSLMPGPISQTTTSPPPTPCLTPCTGTTCTPTREPTSREISRTTPYGSAAGIGWCNYPPTAILSHKGRSASSFSKLSAPNSKVSVNVSGTLSDPWCLLLWSSRRLTASNAPKTFGPRLRAASSSGRRATAPPSWTTSKPKRVSVLAGPLGHARRSNPFALSTPACSLAESARPAGISPTGRAAASCSPPTCAPRRAAPCWKSFSPSTRQCASRPLWETRTVSLNRTTLSPNLFPST